MPLKKYWAKIRQRLPPRNHPSPRHDNAGMRPQPADRTDSEIHHQEYLDKLPVPTLETVKSIAKTQEEKEKEIDRKYAQAREDAADDGDTAEKEERNRAASTIQVGTMQSQDICRRSLHIP